ncbi:DUF3913 family protein [Micromonospora maritima]|uniref:DUF3913 family protein n=1 Tax=Micromonospora maritima TaxID=986711 RepID=UPI00157C385C|nr:DUF3913 family protein [Micromonospora maritima]
MARLTFYAYNGARYVTNVGVWENVSTPPRIGEKVSLPALRYDERVTDIEWTGPDEADVTLGEPTPRED